MEPIADKYQITFETWNKLAQLYEDKFMHLTNYNDSYDCLIATISKPSASILELGCGPGNIAKYLLNKQSEFKILGTDISANMIALAQKNNPTANFQLLDAREILTLNQKFDAIVAGFCLPYLSAADCNKFIQDSKKLLNNNGILYISFVEGDYAQSGFKTGSTGYAAYFYYHSLANLQELLLEHGFRELHVLHTNYSTTANNTEIHTILIAQLKQIEQ